MILYYTGPTAFTDDSGTEWEPGDTHDLKDAYARLLMRKNRWMKTEPTPKPKAKTKATKEEVGKDE